MGNLTKYCTIIIFVFSTSIGFSQTASWDWVRSAGGVGDDVGFSITNDHNNNILVAGKIVSVANFDSLAIASMTYNGGGFIAKYDSSGNILWLNGISGSRTTAVQSIATDLNNNVYVCGHFTEITYTDIFSLTSNGSSDAFIGKYSANGNLLWIKSAGGIGLDGAMSLICSDSLLFVAGEFRDSVYFDNTLLVSSGNSDIFLACLDFEGNYKWIKQAGGLYYDVPRSISIDNNSDIIIAGHINTSANFGITDTSVFTYGSIDPFVAKYSSAGEFLWVNSFGSIAEDRGISVISDINNNLFLHGHFYGTAYFDTITLQSTGIEDYFICKLQPNGDVVWANKIETRIDPYDDFWNHTLESDEQGNIYITGYFMDSLVYDSFSVQSNGSYDIFVIKIDNVGDLVWCLTAGNDHSYGDYSRSIARDDNGNLFITGRFYSTLFFGDSSITSNGSADIFIAKISETPLNIDFLKETTQIDIFPNPTSSFLSIVSEDNEIQKVEILNNNGKLISSYKNTNMNQIDVSDLSKGVYFVRVFFEQMTITSKIIII
jgi:hypothetical protein